MKKKDQIIKLFHKGVGATKAIKKVGTSRQYFYDVVMVHRFNNPYCQDCPKKNSV